MISFPLYASTISETVQNRLEAACSFLKNADFSALPDDTLSINGEIMYAMIQSFDIQEPLCVPFETHKKYIDIQFVLDGTLELEVTNRSRLTPCSDYDIQNDVIFYKENIGSKIVLHKGDMAVLFPCDGHRMFCSPLPNEIHHIRKCVVKVSVEDNA